MALRSSGSLSLKSAVVGLLCLLVPIASWAHSSATKTPGGSCLPDVCVYNSGGAAAGGLSGLNVTTPSNVFDVGGQSVTGNLTFTAGAFTNLLGQNSFGSGTCKLGAGGSCNLGTFAAGTLTITVNNWNGFSGTLFSGTFGSSTGGISWQYDGHHNGEYLYALIGPVSGTWGPTNGTVGGQSAQLLFASSTPFKPGTGKQQTLKLSTGTTMIVTPEPANIGLLGTGLILMGFLVRRRAKQQQSDESKN